MFFFAVVAAFLASVCADSIPSKLHPQIHFNRLLGSQDAAIETYPYQVSLEEFGRHSCGGSIISAHYVLTAAHCVANSDVEAWTIRAGSSNIKEGGIEHQVEEVIPHEKYYTNKYGVPVNDIALVRVKKPFRFDETHQPINLYGKSDIPAPGQRSVITGWDVTDHGQLVRQLQAAQTVVIDNKLCHEAYLATHGGLPVGQFCAGYYGIDGKDACQGNTGGPVAINGRLAGIVSWGNGCALANYPGVNTEVAYYSDWINQHVQF